MPILLQHGELLVEFGLHLLLPLPRQRGWSDDQDAVNQPPFNQLFHHNAGLDGLAQPYFIGQQRRIELVPVVVNVDVIQADEPVEAGCHP